MRIDRARVLGEDEGGGREWSLDDDRLWTERGGRMVEKRKRKRSQSDGRDERKG